VPQLNSSKFTVSGGHDWAVAFYPDNHELDEFNRDDISEFGRHRCPRLHASVDMGLLDQRCSSPIIKQASSYLCLPQLRGARCVSTGYAKFMARVDVDSSTVRCKHKACRF
jgi:hypothetical protein